MRWLVIGVLSLAFLATFAAGAQAKWYRNYQFGFGIENPGLPFCAYEVHPLLSDHGIDLFLDDGPSECGGDIGLRPFISVIGNYNSNFQPNAQAVADFICELDGGAHVAPPKHLHIDGLRTGVCQSMDNGGWIIVGVAAQAGKPPKWQHRDDEPEFDTPRYNYEVTLHTRPAHFAADLKRLRAVLKSLRLYNPEG